jgi:hypothetical protein
MHLFLIYINCINGLSLAFMVSSLEALAKILNLNPGQIRYYENYASSHQNSIPLNVSLYSAASQFFV